MTLSRIAVGIALLLGALFAWKLLHPVHTYRFRLTVSVEKDGQTRSGSSIIELRTRRQPFLSQLPEVPEWETSVRGEAVFVDLGEGDHVIALLTGKNSSGARTAELPSRAILGDAVAYVGPSGVLDTLSTMHRRALREAEGRSYELSAKQMPPLIRFKRLEDPSSVERVKPDAGSVSARLEITRDKASKNIREHLPWLDRLEPDRSLSGQGMTMWEAGQEPFSKPRQITYTNFIESR